MEDRMQSGMVVAVAYGAALLTGLCVVLAPVLILDRIDPEPSGTAVIVVVVLAAFLSVVLGRAAYRGTIDFGRRDLRSQD